MLILLKEARISHLLLFVIPEQWMALTSMKQKDQYYGMICSWFPWIFHRKDENLIRMSNLVWQGNRQHSGGDLLILMQWIQQHICIVWYHLKMGFLIAGMQLSRNPTGWENAIFSCPDVKDRMQRRCYSMVTTKKGYGCLSILFVLWQVINVDVLRKWINNWLGCVQLFENSKLALFCTALVTWISETVPSA